MSIIVLVFFGVRGAPSPAGGGREERRRGQKSERNALRERHELIEKERAGGREGRIARARVRARTARRREREQGGSGKVKDAVELGQGRRATGEPREEGT